ncbi:MAG: cation transporter, partial [Marinobacter sp.]|nr:cation transporter [Marinobacter sp.]
MSDTPVLQTMLSISGASCQGCAKKIRNALEPLTGDAGLVEVDLDQQTVALPDGVDAAEAARIVTETGYPAERFEAASEPASCCASKPKESKGNDGHKDQPSPKSSEPRSDSSQSSAPDSEDGQIHLSVTGATCASCVNTIEKALMSVGGVSHAHMNLADNTATATGDPDPAALVKAVESAGYGASVIHDEDEADDRKQAQDKKQYKSLLVKMAVSLGLGLGLMVWGMGFGTMMVTEANQGTWLGLGVLTLIVMAATGGHFYTGAWKAFRHHNAMAWVDEAEVEVVLHGRVLTVRGKRR